MEVKNILKQLNMARCKKGKCLIEGCPVEKIYSRGLCPTHYRMIRRLVLLNRRTWDEFVKVGMAYIPQRGRSAIQQWTLLNKMMKKRGIITNTTLPKIK